MCISAITLAVLLLYGDHIVSELLREVDQIKPKDFELKNFTFVQIIDENLPEIEIELINAEIS